MLKTPEVEGDSYKIEPKLRMLANCDQQVNENRARQSGNIVFNATIKSATKLRRRSTRYARPEFTPDLKKQPLAEPSNNILTNILVELMPGANPAAAGIANLITRNGNFIAAQVPITKVKDISGSHHVLGVEAAKVLKLVDPIVNKSYPSDQPELKFADLRQLFPVKNRVLIGVIDVGGFDFSHPEFLNDDGTTRFISIWDQGSDFRSPPKDFKYGAEFTSAHLNKALQDATKVGVAPTQLEKQSATTVGSHGTHVASIAAGKHGVFPDCNIVGVTIALTNEDLDRRKSFYDSASIIHAIDYLLKIAAREDLPISINISLGTNGHAHDGSDITSRWIDSELNTPGRSICVASGNAGQERALSENDLGFTMGRIHTRRKIEATGLTKDIRWVVVGDGIADASENELEIWYNSQDRISIMIKPPGMSWVGPVSPTEYIENMQLTDGSYLSIYNELYHWSNGNNYINIFLSPNFKDPDNQIPVKSGVWQVRLIGTEIKNGEFDGWIERDDPRPIGAFGSQETWNFPSFFTEDTNQDDGSISSLACARYVIAVANCDAGSECVNMTSSQGPTRDNREKPEVLAPGTNILAAKGFAHSPDDRYMMMSGTSMASPFACGIAAWMLGLDRNLRAAQIRGIMIRTCKPLPGDSYLWKNSSGFGLLDVQACLTEAQHIKTKKKIDP
jgi:subtilisin family serine protease